MRRLLSQRRTRSTMKLVVCFVGIAGIDRVMYWAFSRSFSPVIPVVAMAVISILVAVVNALIKEIGAFFA